MAIILCTSTNAYWHCQHYRDSSKCGQTMPSHFLGFNASHWNPPPKSLWRRKSVLRLYRPLWNRMKLARERVSFISSLYLTTSVIVTHILIQPFKICSLCKRLPLRFRALGVHLSCSHLTWVLMNLIYFSILCFLRTHVSHPSQLILRYENQAATTIQSYWRGYYESTNYSILYYEVSYWYSCSRSLIDTQIKRFSLFFL